MLPNLIILLVLVASTGWAAPRGESLWGVPYTASEPNRRGCRQVLDDDTLHIYDAIKITPHLQFDFTGSEISGYVMYQVTPRGALDIPGIDLRFVDEYEIDSVWAERPDRTANYAWVGADSLYVSVPEWIMIADTVTLGIAYHGTPPDIDDWGGFRFAPASLWRPRIGFSMGDGLALDPPPSNYNWLPSFADPTDKVEWESYFVVPTDLVVSSGGALVDTTAVTDSTMLWHYRLDEPVSTYLLFVAISEYEVMVQRESNPRIEHFVYPSRVTQAQTHFSNVSAALDGFADLFGPYPFDRFGFAMTRTGDMEHATCVSHFDAVVAGNHSYDWLLFHELSHQWWGDWVTLGDWRDLWLNEGFATYCEALGMEIMGGREAYTDYVVNSIYPDARAATDSYSIYDPDYYWGRTVYQKGAAVMHMLREVVGDSVFFTALQDYGQTHAYGNAVTADWQSAVEQAYGDTLGWFFDQWVYGTRFPRYRVTVWIDFDVPMLTIEQVQTSETLFRMPVDVVLSDGIGDTSRATIWVEATRERQNWQLLGGGEFESIWPTNAVLDPDNKILKTAEYFYLSADDDNVSLPTRFKLNSVYPNPFNSGATLAFFLPRESGTRLTVFNTLGQVVGEHNLGPMTAGDHKFAFDGSAYASGLYFFTLSTPYASSTVKAVLLK